MSAATEEDKDGAHTAVSLAVREGRLPPLGTCLLCDQPAAARHHWSYLPEHWLDDPDDASVPLGAELEHSGG